MLRKVLIVAIMCFVAVAAPTAMYAARAEVAGNHQLAIAAATKASTAATKTPTATSKNTKATKTPTPASKSESATKTPTPASKANDKRDLNDPKGATAKCNGWHLLSPNQPSRCVLESQGREGMVEAVNLFAVRRR
ncbi:MAG: hypothetical protein ACR2OU_15015 [Thermomicrobiales bacterium]